MIRGKKYQGNSDAGIDVLAPASITSLLLLPDLARVRCLPI